MNHEIRHFPGINEEGILQCEECHIQIDVDIFKAGNGFVLEIPNLGFIPAEHFAVTRATPCTNTKAVKAIKDLSNSRVELIKEQEDNKKPERNDDQFKEERKQRTRASWNNFLAMREMTRLPE